MENDVKLQLEIFKEHHDIYAKGIGLWLVANAAGLAGCLTFIKGSSPSQAETIAVVVISLGVGLLCAISGYVFAAGLRMSELQKIAGDSPFRFHCVFEYGFYLFALFSSISFSAAVWGVMKGPCR